MHIGSPSLHCMYVKSNLGQQVPAANGAAYAMKLMDAGNTTEGALLSREVQILRLVGPNGYLVKLEHVRRDHLLLELLHSRLFDHRTSSEGHSVLPEKVAGHFFAQLVLAFEFLQRIR